MRKQKVYPESNLATLRFCILIANLACLREIMVLMLIQIQRWLMMPKVWRFVCFISCVIGLLCYALSSSFNLLFGKWMWWKILLYIVFSFFIGLAFLFLKPWERSTSPRLETHMAYLVLMMTSVYSFFFDKEASGKADAYSLVSTAAFAIMSLGLSKLSHCGFEVDLLYFFCAFLVLQLIKVKLWLVIVGAGFTYSLFTLRSYLDTRVYLGLQIQDQVDIEIGSYSQEITSDASQVGSISPHAHTDPVLMIVMPEEFVSPPQNEDLEFLATQTDSLLQEGNIDSGLLLEQSLGCIEALKKENGKAMNAIWKHVEEYLKANVVYEDQIPVPELHQDDNLVMDALPSGIINDLNATLRMMVRTVVRSAVRGEWCRVYISWRREFLKECVSMFGLRVKEINMEDDDNIMEIVENWIKASNVAVMVLFPNESRLQDRVFGEYISHGKYALEEVCKELQISLLSFVNTLETWIWSHSPTAFSGFIRKVYITLHALIQKLPHRSLDENGHELMKVGERVCKNLDILLKLQNPTYGFKAPQTTAPDGGLHPFTLEVMNYICDVSLVTVNSVGEGELSLCKHVANITERLETFFGSRVQKLQ
ncbi:hypothetical protein VNO77_31991 [Canavalia gladiata]|uniref:Exocyst subunit Exo70 family protein n=1 Tax=Canavalia gladiata TaxID=3824 RepID=A0AAN9KSB7_CANGL